MINKPFEKEKFEIWTKQKLKVGTICKWDKYKFKVLDCQYLRKQKCYAILGLWLKKIAMLTPTFHKWSGIDRLVEQTATEASKAGHDVTVFASEISMK